jgi:glutamine phosphoribosylpyrophosphate amidotransferase
VEEIRRYLKVDSLAYLSLEGMLSCLNSNNGDFCTACFSGDYAIPVDANFRKTVFERNQLTFFEAPRQGEASAGNARAESDA